MRSRTLVLGILAHVDAGKTTLSESLLYAGGALRKAGRVDKGDTFLDTYAVEKERGITVFSKQAVIKGTECDISLMDTPGHVDFSAEMERILQILDGAILMLGGADGIQAHTRTLWKLLKQYDIPVILFVNKMDQEGAEKETILSQIQENFGEGCVDFSRIGTEAFYENIAMCEETALERFLESGKVETPEIRRLIRDRKLFPCYFGSALRQEGITELLEGVLTYLERPSYPETFGARVYKIGRDEQGNRLSYLKITGGRLAVKDMLVSQTGDGEIAEKVNQIRLYSGAKYETLPEAEAGRVVAVTGPEHTRAGDGLGCEKGVYLPVLEPLFSYRMILPDHCDMAQALAGLRQLEEEEPQLHIVWDEEGQELQLKLMGEIQIQILQRQIRERYGLDVSFGPGNIVYKETIKNRVEGVGHFEPLRHYAEVHLLLEPAEAGSGMQFDSACSEDVLDRNWQRLVLTHLREKEHRGVLTGSALTDMKITLLSGRAHIKHTEGGDFRQAVYRAVRQGLMQAESVLLEPYYEFVLEVPDTMTGRAMTDLSRLHASAFQPEMEDGIAKIRGSAPAACLQGYQKEVAAYTGGLGCLNCTFTGYGPCHNMEEVIERRAYDAERDLQNPSSSVFCAHGAGFLVPWDKVGEYMHLPFALDQKEPEGEEALSTRMERRGEQKKELSIGTEEIDAILQKTAGANKKGKRVSHKGIPAGRRRAAGRKGEGMQKEGAQSGGEAKERRYGPQPKKPEYLLVDGYNVIFAWEELKELAKENLDGARGRLLDILSNYQGIRGCELIVVFDAYRLEGHAEEFLDYHNIHVVYTKEAETADRYIEKFAHVNAARYRISVATSDGLEQIIIRGAGCALISARELAEEIERESRGLLEAYREGQEKGGYRLRDFFPGEKDARSDPAKGSP